MKALIFVLPFAAATAAPPTPVEIYQRTQAIFENFNIPRSDSSALIQKYAYTQNPADLKRVLQIIDPSGLIARYSTQDQDSFSLFRDKDSYKVIDAEIPMSGSAQSYVSQAIEHLLDAKQNPPELPLDGIKVLLDPGHMSTDYWDKQTGKFIVDRSGRKISEGFLALQTCLILKSELEKLGAIVKLTREDHDPVSKLPVEQLDMEKWAKRTLEGESLEPWFLSLVKSRAAGPALFNAVRASPQYRKMLAPSSRMKYFVEGEELEARVGVIKKFEPDISLVIHFDVAFPLGASRGLNNKPHSKVKTYVHGGMAPTKWAAARDRHLVLEHLFDSKSFEASFLLAKEVVNNLSQGLGLGFDSSGGGGSKEVAKGVFARNLIITRHASNHAHAYVECLHYNDPTEFKALLAKDFELEIDGKKTYYSKRLKTVADSLQNGILSFMKALK